MMQVMGVEIETVMQGDYPCGECEVSAAAVQHLAGWRDGEIPKILRACLEWLEDEEGSDALSYSRVWISDGEPERVAARTPGRG